MVNYLYRLYCKCNGSSRILLIHWNTELQKVFHFIIIGIQDKVTIE